MTKQDVNVLAALRAEIAAEEASLQMRRKFVLLTEDYCRAIQAAGADVEVMQRNTGPDRFYLRVDLGPAVPEDPWDFFQEAEVVEPFEVEHPVASAAYVAPAEPKVFESSPAPDAVGAVEPAAGGLGSPPAALAGAEVPAIFIADLEAPSIELPGADNTLAAQLVDQFAPEPPPAPLAVDAVEPAAGDLDAPPAALDEADDAAASPDQAGVTGPFGTTAWTTSEDDRMIRLSQNLTARLVGEALGRSERAVQQRMTRLRAGRVALPAGWRIAGGVFIISASAAVDDVAIVPIAEPEAGTLAVKGAEWNHDPRPARPIPAPAAALVSASDPRFASAPQDDLTAHLLSLPRDTIWTWDRDVELAELIDQRWSWEQIADEMGRKPREVQARFDLLTGLARGSIVRKFIKSAMVERMKLLARLATPVPSGAA